MCLTTIVNCSRTYTATSVSPLAAPRTERVHSPHILVLDLSTRFIGKFFAFRHILDTEPHFLRQVHGPRRQRGWILHPASGSLRKVIWCHGRGCGRRRPAPDHDIRCQMRCPCHSYHGPGQPTSIYLYCR